MIVAGEPSGDLHAAGLVRALGAAPIPYDCFGMGLDEMKRAGLRCIVNAKDLAVVGLFEVIVHYPRLRRVFRRLVRALEEEKPKLLVLVDYPEFNLKLAAEAHRLGVKVLFYISPQVWAWRAGRVRKITRRVDAMAVVFPFEQKIYRDAGVPVHYVGHPLIEQMPPQTGAAQRATRDDSTRKVLLMPGSRRGEVHRLLPVLCRAAVRLRERIGAIEFSLPLASGIPEDFAARVLLDHRLECKVVRENPEETWQAMRNADLAITASGTATLQLALCETPMVIVYKVAWPTYFLLKKLVKTPHIGLVNILSGKAGRTAIAPELIQGNANDKAIAREALALLENEKAMQKTRHGLREIRKILGDGNASENLARLVQKMVEAQAL